MLDNNMKLNLFIGGNFNELISLPTNKLIIRNLLSVTDRDVIVLDNNLSLPELVQMCHYMAGGMAQSCQTFLILCSQDI